MADQDVKARAVSDRDYQRIYDEVYKELVTPDLRRKLALLTEHAGDLERDRLAAELARVEAEHREVVHELTSENDALRAEVERLGKERDEANERTEQMKIEVYEAVEESFLCGQIAAEHGCLVANAPHDAVRTLANRYDEIRAALARVTQERDAAVELRKKWQANMKDIRQQRDDAERRVAERIAAWLVDEAKMIDAGANPYAPTDDISVARSDALRSAADDILAMTWRTGGGQ